MRSEITRELLDQIKATIESQDEASLTGMLEDLHPADIAEICEELEWKDSHYLYNLLDDEIASDVLAELEEPERDKLLGTLPPDIIARKFIGNMDSDDAADVLSELTDERREEILSHLKDIDQAGDIVDLMSYDEDTAGGLMAKELIKVNENWTVQMSLKEMRKQAKDVDEVYYVYVVDDDNVLRGILSLKKLLLAKLSSRIRNLMEKDVISVRTDTHSDEITSLMKKYDLVVLPVVDSLGRLMGRITIDDVVDVITEEADKDYQMASGLMEDVEITDSAWILTRARLPWLMIALFGGLVVNIIISNFENEIKINPQMAFFMPLIAAMAGNMGIQSSAIVVQGIANNTLGFEGILKKLIKEFFVGIMNGMVLSSVLLAFSIITAHTLSLTITVSLSLLIVIVFAAVFGTLIPLVLHRLNIDPALATGPFITTMNDIMGLVIYFSMGRVLFTII